MAGEIVPRADAIHTGPIGGGIIHQIREGIGSIVNPVAEGATDIVKSYVDRFSPSPSQTPSSSSSSSGTPNVGINVRAPSSPVYYGGGGTTHSSGSSQIQTPQQEQAQQNQAQQQVPTQNVSVNILPEYAAYGSGGTYTSYGKFYPDLGAGQSFNPQGTSKAFADIQGNQIRFVPNEVISQTVSTPEGPRIGAMYLRQQNIDREQSNVNQGSQFIDILSQNKQPIVLYGTNEPLQFNTNKNVTKLGNESLSPSNDVDRVALILGGILGEIGTSTFKSAERTIARPSFESVKRLSGIDINRAFDIGDPTLMDYASTVALVAAPFSTGIRIVSGIGFGLYAGYNVADKLINEPDFSFEGKVRLLADVALISTAFAEPVKYGREPIEVFKDKAIKTQDIPNKLSQKIYNLFKDGESQSITSFQIKSYTPERYGYYVPRYQVVFDKAISNLIGIGDFEKLGSPYGSKYSLEQVKEKFPNAEKVEVQPPRVALTTTEKFIVSEGKILGPATKDLIIADIGKEILVAEDRATFVSTQTATPNRVSTIKLSKLAGETSKEPIEISKLNRENLDAINKKLLDVVEDLKEEGIMTSKGEVKSSTRIEYPDETKVHAGEVGIETRIEVLKNGDVYIKPRGRTIERGQTISMQKVEQSINYDVELGLTGYQLLDERMAGVDVTKPRVPIKRVAIVKRTEKPFYYRTPRSVSLLKGKVEVFDYTLPSDKVEVNTIKGIKPIRTKSQELALKKQLYGENLKTIQQVKSVALLKNTRALRPRTISPSTIKARLGYKELPKYVGGLGIFSSQFAGQGLYEKTIGGQLPFGSNKESNRMMVNDVLINRLILPTREVTISLPSYVNKEVTRELARDIVREIPREVTKETTREVTKEIQRETQKEMQREIQREIQRETERTIIIFPPMPRINKPPEPPPPRGEDLDKRALLNNKKKRPAFSVFLKRFGKFNLVGTGLPRGLATLKAEQSALRSIGRTSKIVESGYTDILDVDYNVNQNLFRNYIVRKGRAIPTPNIFIQRQGKSIVTPEEKIQLAESRRLAKLMNVRY